MIGHQWDRQRWHVMVILALAVSNECTLGGKNLQTTNIEHEQNIDWTKV